jgi:hypothetical protein
MNRVERLDKRNEMALQKLKKDVEYYRPSASARKNHRFNPDVLSTMTFKPD